MTLSKSNYMLFLRHPAWLWLKKFEKYKLPPIDDNLQVMFDAGHEFEVFAEKLFPDGVRLGYTTNGIFDGNKYRSLPQRTKEAIDNDIPTIFQGRFEVDGITCIIDVVKRVGGNTFDLIEIKSSTNAKPEHFYDLAFQTIVLEKSRINIRNISVMHVNNEYVRNGDIEPEKLVAKTDVTEDVRELVGLTTDQIDEVKAILDPKTMPDISPRYVNQIGVSGTSWFADWMSIYKTLESDLDEYSIYNLSYPNSEQIEKLEDGCIELISEVPEELALRPKQVAQIQTTRDNKRILKKDKIKKFLDTFEYPLYFFDYETFSSVIPAFDGCKPYKDYPFQYSLHVLDSPDANVRHVEYLHADSSNPMPGLIEQLKTDIGDKGTILTWNMSYEKRCNDTMAHLYPEHKKFLDSVNERIEDLMTPFSEMWLVDKDFFGSASIKKVLPVIVPELSHGELEVQDGLYARRLWTQTVLEGRNQDNKDQILKDLSAYCTLDTYAMVRILEELKKILKD